MDTAVLAAKPKIDASQLRGAAAIRAIFDADFYLRANPDVGAAGVDPLRHYLDIGWAEGRNPNALFDSDFYLDSNADVFEAGLNPLVHYVSNGAREGRNPHPLFDTRFYAETYPDLGEANPLAHYLCIGAGEHRAPNLLFDAPFYARMHPEAAANPLAHYAEHGLARQLSPHPLFDGAYYLAQHPDVAAAKMNPLAHYLLRGHLEVRNPHPLFDSQWYAARNPDIAEAKVSPLAHYVRHGARLGASPHPLFDTAWYLEQYKAEVGEADALVHYITSGAAALRQPNPLFDAAWYVRQHPEAAQNPLAHYAEHGLTRRLSPHPLFDGAFYLDKYPDVAAAGMNPLTHYLLRGAEEVRDPNPEFDAAAYVKEYPDAVGVHPLVHHNRTRTKFPTYRRPNRADRIAGLLESDKTKINVMLVAHSVPKDGRLFGAERSFLDMAEAIAQFDCNLHILLPNSNASYIDKLRGFCTSIFVSSYPWWREKSQINDRAVTEVRQVIRDNNIQFVYANTIMLREPLVAARAEGALCAVHCRELITGDPHLSEIIGLAPDDIVRKVRESADILVANSRATAKVFIGEGKGLIAPNIVAVDEFASQPLKSGAMVKRIGIISSNIKKKGIEDFVKLAALCAHVENLEFHVIGPDTALVKELKIQQGEGILPPNLFFDGYIESPHEALEPLDVLLCLSSFAESFGRTIAEAMAAAKLVIAYDVGAVSELLENGETGYLVTKGDVEAVATVLSEFATEPDSYEHIRTNARNFISTHHAPAALALAYDNLFAEIGVRRKPANAEKVANRSLTSTATPSKARLRIAYFCWHFPVPSETFVLNELRVLQAEGHLLHVFCRQIPHPDFTPDFPINFSRVQNFEELAEKLRLFGADVVHGHFVYPTITDMVWPAAERAGIPFTFIAHAQDIFKYSNDARNRLEEVTQSPLCRKVFTLSRFHREYLIDRGVPAGKIAINPNGIDPTLFSSVQSGAKKSRKSVCAVARFVAKKGIDLLIGAAPLLAKENIDIHIYGYGELDQTYRRLISELSATNVRIHGPVEGREALLRVFSEHDLCICPSVRTPDGDMDGIPTILLEAMAAELPVVATSISGIPDLVIDGVTGFVCEPTPESIAEVVREFYRLPSGVTHRIRKAALEHVISNHDVRRLVKNLVRVWRHETVAIVLVTWHNLPELREVLRRIMHFTTLPIEVSICDNNSDAETRQFLQQFEKKHSNVHVRFNSENALVGPGTNLALENVSSDYAIYVCGKEGFALDFNWEHSFIYALDDNRDAALAGTLCYSPSYLHGRDFEAGNPRFNDFRSKNLCIDNPDREFLHVQGGLFAMRTAAVKQAGGFSNLVPHNGTDVELSVHLENLGWKLARVKGMLSIYNKTLPPIQARMDESIRIAHPPTLSDLSWIDAVVGRQLHLCPVCGWRGRQFNGHLGEHICPGCECDGDDRTLWRFLTTETTFTFRRLPALAVGLSGRMLEMWQQQFQGVTTSVAELEDALGQGERLANRTGSMSVALVNARAPSKAMYSECHRLLAPDLGALLVVDDAICSLEMQKLGFKLESSHAYSSFACRFGWRAIHRFARTELQDSY